MPKIKLSSLKPSRTKLSSGKEITTMEEAVKLVGDYRFLFTDKFVKDFINAFPTRFNAAKNESERGEVSSEAEDWVLSYALFIYKLYPNDANSQKMINSSQEFKSNFKLLKDWLDKRHGQQIADEYMGG